MVSPSSRVLGSLKKLEDKDPRVFFFLFFPLCQNAHPWIIIAGMEVFPKVFFSLGFFSFFPPLLTQSFSTSHNIVIYFLHSLGYNNISAEGARALADALCTNTALTTLKWGGLRGKEKREIENKRGTLSPFFQRVLSSSSSLYILHTSALVKLEGDGDIFFLLTSHPISSSFFIPSCSQTFFFRSLAKNNIFDEGVKALADALRTNTTLTNLKLEKDRRREREREREREMI